MRAPNPTSGQTGAPSANPSAHPALELEDRDRGDVVVLCDASVEGEDIAAILRTRGFLVYDVPLALLESRLSSDSPRLVIVDIDQSGAVEKVRRIRGEPEHPEVFCIGDALRAAEIDDLSLSDSVFERPVDVQRLVERALGVATPSPSQYGSRGTTPPPLYPARPSVAAAPDSIPPISEFPRAQDPLDLGSFLDDDADPATTLGLLAGGQVRLSPELAYQILQAEERVRADIEEFANPSSDDADCELPPELLSQLDEPLDPVEDLDGTGGVPAGAAASSSADAGSVALSLNAHALTPAPRPGTLNETPPPPETQAPRGRVDADGVEAPEPIAPTRPPQQLRPSAADGSKSRTGGAPEELTSAPRAAPSNQGTRADAVLSQRGDEPRRVENTTRGPPGGMAEAAALPSDLPSLPLYAANPASLTPLSPPVRFQEPRDIAEGRAVFDLRTVPPRPPTSLRAAEVVRPPRPPLVVPMTATPATPSRAPTERDEGVSPAAQSVRTAPPPRESSAGGAVFGELEGGKPLARAIAGRVGGCLSFSTGEGQRKIVLMDGDVVTASSDIADESLIAFLAGRGDLDREAAVRLAGKLPPSGRHAGAALIAQGFLAQNDLWPVLRAHAQWLIGKVLLSGPGSSELDDELPGRLKAEPSVFGGAPGAEVFVETARRVLDPGRTVASLDSAARLDAGPRLNLLSECALSAEDEARIRSAPGKTVAEVCPPEQPEFVSVLRAVIDLDVLTLLAPVHRSIEPKRGEIDPLDEEAVRQKVRAKMVLVEEGDYFALLGVNRSATSYEIKRAFLELRRTFEPSKLLTAQTVDLHDQVTLILEVIEEAFEILRDDRRRERYRRAIEAGPPEH